MIANGSHPSEISGFNCKKTSSELIPSTNETLRTSRPFARSSSMLRTFRANTGGAQQKSCWTYSVNTIVNAGPGTDVSKVAEEDLVKMYIEVVKAYSYTTTAGGSTTVPLVQVNIIQTTG